MLQIYIHGTKEQGFLDVREGTMLTIESTSELFDEDLTSGEFTLPVEIPWTNNNRKLLNFAERIENFRSSQQYWKCDVYEDGFPEMTNGKLTILEKNGSLSYSNGTFTASISGTKGLFGSLVKNKKLTDLRLGGAITWQGKTSRKFAQDLMNGLYPQYPQIAFAPVAIQSFFDGKDNYVEDRMIAFHPDINLVKDTVNNIIVWGNGPNDWGFGRPDPDNPTAFLTESDYRLRDYRTVPFFNLKFILKNIFSEHGFTLTGEFMDSTDFNDVFLYNSTAIEHYQGINIDTTRSIQPQNHVPPLTIKDFLKSFFDFFNLFPRFLSDNEIRLVYRHQYIRQRTIAPITAYAEDKFSSNFENVADNKGYTVEYDYDSADSYPGNNLKELSEKTLVGSVSTFANLMTLNIGRAFTTDDIAYVEADNTYYQVADATTSPITWEVYTDGLLKIVEGEGERQVSIAMAPLCQYVLQDEDSGLLKRMDMVAADQNGSYLARKTKGFTRHDFGARIFYIKKLNRGGVNVPVSFYHNRAANNSRIVPYSLALNGPDGMFLNFHKKWQDIKSNMEIVKNRLTTNQKITQEINAAAMLEINNVLFLPYRTERTIPSQGTMEIQMVPL